MYSRGMQTDETWTGEGNEEVEEDGQGTELTEKQVLRKGVQKGAPSSTVTVSTSTSMCFSFQSKSILPNMWHPICLSSGA